MNEKTNHGYTFDLVELPAECEFRVVEHLWPYQKDLAKASRTSPPLMIDWPKAVAVTLERWLFQYLIDGRDTLNDTNRHFSLSDPENRRRVSLQVARILERALAPTKVLAGHTTTDLCDDCHSEQLLFETPNRRYLLHLGVSD